MAALSVSQDSVISTEDTKTEQTNKSVTKSTSSDPKLLWVVKPCEEYDAEYSDCRRFGARFNQYFVEGELADCSPWKRDSDNCWKWEKHRDVEAVKAVIESEKGRIRERLQGHYNNDIWEPRKEPLTEEEWNAPLPTDITQGYETSFLKQKADELKRGEESLGEVDENLREERFLDSESPSSCSIV